MAGKRSDYSQDAVAAARIVLIELAHLLEDYQGDFVVVGGWVPELLLSDAATEHIGSIDVDIALNRTALQKRGHPTLRQLLEGAEYKAGDRPFTYHRTVTIGGRPITVAVDFMVEGNRLADPQNPHLDVQEIVACKARGCDIAMTMSEEILLDESDAAGNEKQINLRVAGIVPFLIMKGFALHERENPKDCYDILFCIDNYPGGPDALANAVTPYLDNPLVIQSLSIIKSRFKSPYDRGPMHVADFEQITDPDQRDLRERDAYEKTRYILDSISREE